MNAQKSDGIILATALALSTLGVVLVFSASASARDAHGDMFLYLRRQLVFLGLGLAAMLAAARFPYRGLRALSMPLFLLSMLMMAAVFAGGLGMTVHGATRWLKVGPLTMQPSEVAKLALVTLLASFLSSSSERGKEGVRISGGLKVCFASAVMIGMCALQRDFGCAVVVGAVTVGMLFVAGVRLSYLLMAALAALPFFYHFLMKSPERVGRIMAFFNPWDSTSDSGYHLVQSLISFGSGGLWGKGLGSGTQTLLYLPFAHNDFIFATVGQQLGFAGVAAVLGLFALFAWRGLRSALRSTESFGLHLGFGLTLLVVIQAVFNMAVTEGLLPTKGLNLPYISYGGTSLVVSLCLAGVLANVSACPARSD